LCRHGLDDLLNLVGPVRSGFLSSGSCPFRFLPVLLPASAGLIRFG
jgi:hypothetical protein